MAELPVARCNRLLGHDDAGRELVCGKDIPGHPLHVEINGSRALDLELCAEHKQEWYDHNAGYFSRAAAAKVALFKLFEDHKGNLFTTSEIKEYLRNVLKERDELLRDPKEIAAVASIQDKGKLSFEVEALFRSVREREDELAQRDWEEITPALVRSYLNNAFEARDGRLSSEDMRLIARMPETGMPTQPLMDLYARLRREDPDRASESESAASK
jgi:hypothetical protein